MNFELFKETKTRYFAIETLSILFLGLVVLILLSKGLKIRITDSYVVITSFAITVIWLLFALSFIRKMGISLKSFVGKPAKKGFIFELPASLLLTYSGSIGIVLIILFLVNSINPSILGNLQSMITKQSPQSTPIVIKAMEFIAAVIIAPITEELIFRGILMNRLYNKYGMVRSIVYSSIMFFAMHINPNPMLLCLGISCGLLVYKYKSLIPSIILHMCNNLFASIKDLNSTVNQTSDSIAVNSSILVIGIILFLLYVLYVYRSLRKCSVWHTAGN